MSLCTVQGCFAVDDAIHLKNIFGIGFATSSAFCTQGLPAYWWCWLKARVRRLAKVPPACRYFTFLSIRHANPGQKICPTYDIDLVWHAHMSTPLDYKADTVALLGEHFTHDDSINDRSAGSELQSLQKTTETLFAEAGDEFFEPGGMFRGIPKRLTPAERDGCFPGASSETSSCSRSPLHRNCHVVVREPVSGVMLL